MQQPSFQPHVDGQDAGARLRDMHKRTYPLRTLGMGLAALPVAVVLAERDASGWAWAWAAFCGLLWPHLALLLARYNPDPYRADLRNFVVDSALAASLVPLTHFNLLPSAVLLTVVLADKVNTGVRGLWRRSLLPMLAALLASSVLNGFQFSPETSLPAMIASLPLVVIHTLVVSASSYHLVRKVQLQNRRLNELSRQDTLTGLQSRGYWQQMAGNLLAESSQGKSASLLLVDVDQFKTINDRYGHAVGDDLLRAVAECILAALPDEAHAGRLGGDEMAVALPLPPTLASEVAERIRSAVASLAIPGEPGLAGSVSIGIAAPPGGEAGLRGWLEAADRALYRAKDGGRNRTEVELESA